MMIDGLSHLKTLRSQKIVPPRIAVCIDGKFREPKYEQDYCPMELTVCAPIERDDFRPFVGLDLSLYCGDYDQFANRVFEKLAEHANEITVLIASWGTDIGFLWHKQYGKMDMCEIGWLEQYHEARTRVCRNDKETAERVRLENEAKAHLSRNPEDYSNGNLS